MTTVARSPDAISGSMAAARFDTAARQLRVEQVAVPVPAQGEVLVRVEACGICLSDVHLIDGTLPSPLPTVTPGHEAAGRVAALGAGVEGWSPGEPVAMAGGRACGRCRHCRSGRTAECLATEVMGFSYDGAWAQYVVVPAAALVAVPADLPMPQAAILADAVATPYAGLTDRAALRPGEAVGLWGLGGLGVHALQVARLVGAAPIVAVDPLPAARERASALGADVVLDPGSDDVVARVWELTGGQGLDLAVDLVGSNAVLAQAAGCVGTGGRTLMIGLSMEPVQLGPGLLFGLMSQSLLGHLGYSKRHLDELVVLVGNGRLDLSASVSGLLPLESVAEGVEALASKSSSPVRLVVEPWS